MNWLRAFTNNNAVIKNDSSKDRPAGSEIYHQTCAFNGCLEWTLNWNECVDPELLMSLYYITWKHRRFWETHWWERWPYRDVLLNSVWQCSLFRLWLLLSVRSTSLFVLAGKQARMGTCKVESDWRVQLSPIAFHIQLLPFTTYFWPRSWLAGPLYTQIVFKSRLYVQSAERLQLWKQLYSFIPGRIVFFQSGWNRNVLRRSLYITR